MKKHEKQMIFSSVIHPKPSVFPYNLYRLIGFNRHYYKKYITPYKIPNTKNTTVSNNCHFN